MESQSNKVIVITGTSSGLGKLAAKTLAAQGHHVYASMRKPNGRNRSTRDELQALAQSGGVRLRVLEIDVTIDESVTAGIERVLGCEGRIDVLINCVNEMFIGSVEETRVGQRTDFDKLTLSIETDGSIDPEAAVAYGAQLVRKHLEYMLYFGEGGIPEVAPPGAVAVPERLQDLFTRPIEDLAELSVRSRNSLQKENIRSLGDLVQRSEDDMLQIENFGKKSLKEISDFLEEHALRFGMQLEEGEDGRLFFVEDSAEATAED